VSQEPRPLVLHGYWRSGAAYRTRIALNLKGLDCEQRTHDLRTGAQKEAAYTGLNPQGLVPALETPEGLLFQSVAIMEALEEGWPEPPLLPRHGFERATVRAMVGLIACDIHPLNNLRVLKALREDFGADQAQVDAWAGRWITAGFAALEQLVERHGGCWSYGDAPGMVDCCLVPQIYSARRFNVDVAPFPRLLAVDARAAEHPAFAAAHPDGSRRDALA
jgi:maleylpyruvate isomerase